MPSADESTTTQVIYGEQAHPELVLATALLQVESGPDGGAHCPLELQRVRVGTDTDNDLVLTDPLVSRHHLEIQVQDRGYRVLDLGSTNGTFLADARVREALLGVNTAIRLGSSVLRIVSSPPRRQAVPPQGAFGRLVGSSAPMQSLYGLLATVAPSDVTVLLEGETGSGKELVAEEIHRHSPRSSGLFMVVDCGALSSTLVESELFGHERGAFTSAVGERKGVFERASGGTVFLDEVGELPLELQTRLLRVVDRSTVRRVGGDLDRRVDVRIVAATNRDLAQEVRQKRFRKDLYYRLAVVRIVVPPLRERPEDILPLARHFLWEAGCAEPQTVLTLPVVERLTGRSWAGNVRELRNTLQRAVLLSDDGEDLTRPPELELPDAPHQDPDDDPPVAGDWLGVSPDLLALPFRSARDRLNDAFERAYATRLQQHHGTNISGMAREAEVDRQVIRRLLQRLDPSR